MTTQPGPDQNRLLAALREPAAYPHAPAGVEHVETHISHVFLAGDRVYKLKKPVRLDFIDFSTLPRRRHYCLEELRLNRRLAPETYRRVVPIVEHAGSIRVADRAIPENPSPENPPAQPAPGRPEEPSGPGGGGGEPSPIDYAVEMTRLPEAGMMGRRLDAGDIGDQDMNHLAELLADFHDRAERSPEIDRVAGPARMRTRIEANLDDLDAFAAPLPEAPAPDAPILGPKLLETLRHWFDAELTRRRSLMAERVESGRARDGHGDLHAGNICTTDRGWVVFDCIEFDANLRYLDVAAELGFLAMDLGRRGHPDLARALLDRYAARARDPSLFEMQPLYQTHYGLVRAKVDAIAARQHAENRDEGIRRWRGAAEFSAYVAGRALGPALIVLCGLPATGKSHVARALAHPLEAEVLQSDRIRKALMGIEPTEHPSEQDRPDLYSRQTTERTYAELTRRARAQLEAGRSVIADATHPTAAWRAGTLEAARGAGVPAAIVHTTCPEAEIRRRMAARAADASAVSDADLSVYERARDRFEPPAASEGAPVVAVGDEHEPRLMTLGVLESLAAIIDARGASR